MKMTWSGPQWLKLVLAILTLFGASSIAPAQQAAPIPDMDGAIRQILAGQMASDRANYEKCLNGDGWKCSILGDRVSKQDRVAGAALWERACNLKEGAGCFSLGVAYDSGLGVPMNLSLAYTNFAKGCALNYALACQSAVHARDALAPNDPARNVVATPSRPTFAILPGAVPEAGATRAESCQLADSPGGARQVIGLAYTDIQCVRAAYNRIGRCLQNTEILEVVFFAHTPAQRIVLKSDGVTTTRYNGSVAYPLKTGLPCYQRAEVGLSFTRQRGAPLIESDESLLRKRIVEGDDDDGVHDCQDNYINGRYNGTTCKQTPTYLRRDTSKLFLKNVGGTVQTVRIICVYGSPDKGVVSLRPGQEVQILAGMPKDFRDQCFFTYP